MKIKLTFTSLSNSPFTPSSLSCPSSPPLYPPLTPSSIFTLMTLPLFISFLIPLLFSSLLYSPFLLVTCSLPNSYLLILPLFLFPFGDLFSSSFLSPYHSFILIPLGDLSFPSSLSHLFLIPFPLGDLPLPNPYLLLLGSPPFSLYLLYH